MDPDRIRRDPERLTAEFRKEKRDGRLFLDVTRNAYAQHIVGPFGVRARPGAPVATPLHWSEVEDPSVRPEQFSLRSVPGRVASNQQPWGPLRGQSLTKPARILARVTGLVVTDVTQTGLLGRIHRFRNQFRAIAVSVFRHCVH